MERLPVEDKTASNSSTEASDLDPDRKLLAQLGEIYLTNNEICQKYRISRATLYRQIRKDPKFPAAVTVFGQNRRRLSELIAYHEHQEALAA